MTTLIVPSTCTRSESPLFKLLGDKRKKADRLISPLETHDEFWYIAEPWILEAARCRGRNRHSDSFGGLIHLWIAFNAWASKIVSNTDKSETDSYLVAALAWDSVLSESFDKLKQEDEDFKTRTAEFAALWPVFKVQALLEKRIAPWGYREARSDYVRRVLSEYPDLFRKRNHEPKNHAPVCFRLHADSPNSVAGITWNGPPNDWAHTIPAIYQVRCNLFHGGKLYQAGPDYQFVDLSFAILWRFWQTQWPDDVREMALQTEARARKRSAQKRSAGGRGDAIERDGSGAAGKDEPAPDGKGKKSSPAASASLFGE